MSVLSDGETRVVSNHLIWCDNCRRLLLDARDLAQFLRSLYQREALAEYTP